MKEMNIGILVHVYDINEINYGMRLRKKKSPFNSLQFFIYQVQLLIYIVLYCNTTIMGIHILFDLVCG
jgi:hypothetical protein